MTVTRDQAKEAACWINNHTGFNPEWLGRATMLVDYFRQPPEPCNCSEAWQELKTLLHQFSLRKGNRYVFGGDGSGAWGVHKHPISWDVVPMAYSPEQLRDVLREKVKPQPTVESLQAELDERTLQHKTQLDNANRLRVKCEEQAATIEKLCPVRMWQDPARGQVLYSVRSTCKGFRVGYETSTDKWKESGIDRLKGVFNTLFEAQDALNRYAANVGWVKVT